MPDMLFRGTAPALITPFTTDGTVDEAALRRVIDYQIDGGIDALVVLGTTGENPTITHKERQLIVETAIEQVGGRIPVIVGTGTNDTAQSIVFSKEATAAGADGLLVVGPYYNKPSASGLRAHFGTIADAVDTPLILYNVPGRTGSNIPADVTLSIAETVPSVIAVKEAAGSIPQTMDLIRGRQTGFAVYSGDDDLTLPMIALGADGVVSVIANALPRCISRLTKIALSGDFKSASLRHLELLEAMRASFYESNPGPVKAVMAELGLIEEVLRLPLVPVSADTRKRVLDAYRLHFATESLPA